MLPSLPDLLSHEPAARTQLLQQCVSPPAAAADPLEQLHQHSLAFEILALLQAEGVQPPLLVGVWLRQQQQQPPPQVHAHGALAGGALPPDLGLLAELVRLAGLSRLSPEDPLLAGQQAAYLAFLAEEAETCADLSLPAEILLDRLRPPEGHPLEALLSDLVTCDLESGLSPALWSHRLPPPAAPPPSDTAPVLDGGRRWRQGIWGGGVAVAAGLLLTFRLVSSPPAPEVILTPRGTEPAPSVGRPPPGTLHLSTETQEQTVDLVAVAAGVGGPSLWRGQALEVLWYGAPQGAELRLFYETTEGRLVPFEAEPGTALVLHPGDTRTLRVDDTDRAVLVLVAWEAQAQHLLDTGGDGGDGGDLASLTDAWVFRFVVQR